MPDRVKASQFAHPGRPVCCSTGALRATPAARGTLGQRRALVGMLRFYAGVVFFCSCPPVGLGPYFFWHVPLPWLHGGYWHVAQGWAIDHCPARVHCVRDGAAGGPHPRAIAFIEFQAASPLWGRVDPRTVAAPNWARRLVDGYRARRRNPAREGVGARERIAG